jgi:hypothetical protein
MPRWPVAQLFEENRGMGWAKWLSRFTMASCLGFPVIVFLVAILGPRDASFLPAHAVAADVAVPSAPAAEHPKIRSHAGIAKCIRCHNSNVAGAATTLPDGGVISLTDDHWVLYSELSRWGEDHKHTQAYAVLLNERAREMGRILRVPEVDGVPQTHRDKRCLACHTGYPLEGLAVDPEGLIGVELVRNQDVNLGIGCEGCHGPADTAGAGEQTLAGWLGPHQIQPTAPLDQPGIWRFLAPREKLEKYGFRDVRSPASKAKICLSCHLGNAQAGRVVTHEMYAAGHPPLPGFEIATFLGQMRTHWQEFGDKPEPVRTSFLKYTQDPLYKEHYDAHELRKTKSVLVGAAVTLGETMRLAADLAEGKVSEEIAQKPEWPELSQFECFACHHDLQVNGWRTRRKSAGRPGRPRLREWPTALIRIAARRAGIPETELEQHLNSVANRTDASPFGDAALQVSARKLSAWADDLAQRLERRSFPAEEGPKILREICEIATQGSLDYDSARQLVWIFQIVEGEVGQTDGKSEQRKEILAGFSEGAEAMFLLDLRSGRDTTQALPSATGVIERKLLEVDLGKVLPFVERYDARVFRQRFQQLQRLLPAD